MGNYGRATGVLGHILIDTKPPSSASAGTDTIRPVIVGISICAILRFPLFSPIRGSKWYHLFQPE